MIFSFNFLKDYISKDILVDEIAELLMFHSFEIEEIKKKGIDFTLDIDVLANRAHDCFSHIGIAREVCALAMCKLKIPENSFIEKKGKTNLKIDVLSNKDCKRYTLKILENIQVGDSPKWLKERLKSCGLQPINNVVDITNYVMLETGQPLHAFDAEKIGDRVIVRRAKTGEKIKTLDDKEYNLNENILVIASNSHPLAIAGIKGGEDSGIDQNTKTIAIEAANFDQILIRKASRALKLRTDASLRFENGIDESLIDFAQKRVCFLLTQYAKAEVLETIIDSNPKQRNKKKIKLNLNYANQLLGLEIKEEEAIDILERLQFEVEKQSSHLLVLVPKERLDISFAEDLIEELGRIYGYDKIPSIFPKGKVSPPERNDTIFWCNKTKDILKELGFSEVYTYSFASENNLSGVEIINPLNVLNKYLRTNLISNLLKTKEENLKWFDEINIFELGKVFEKGFKEKRRLCCLTTKKDSFYFLKGVLQNLFSELGVKDYDYYLDKGPFAKGAKIKIGNKEVGFIGQKDEAFLFDIDLDFLLTKATEKKQYEQISIFPPYFRDLAIFVPKQQQVGSVLKIIQGSCSDIVKEVELFEVYSGKGIPEGKKSLAFHITYQSKKKTLLSEEVEKEHQKIIKGLEGNLSFKVRK